MAAIGAIEVLQLSDLHVTAGGDLHGQDPRANLDRVLADVERRGLTPDVVVATGDLADDGEPDAYRWLQARLAGFGVPVYCLAGNHDREPAFTDALPGDAVQVVEAADVGAWRFVFLDTNAAGRTVTDAGTVEDTDDRRHGARRGAVLPDDAARFAQELDRARSAPVMVWVHHPPVVHPAFVGVDALPYSRWLTDAAAAAGNVRGVSGGHVHSSHEAERDGVRYFTCPSGWLALDLDAGVLAPPGYRHFRFRPDGGIEATTHWVDDGLGPHPTPFPDWIPKILAEGG